MNTIVINNFSKLRRFLFFSPLFLLLLIVLYLHSQDSLSVEGYIQIQKNCFYFLNSKLSQFPNIEYNLNQFGDSLIALSLLAIFIVYAPKMWEALITASLLSCIISSLLKKIFAIPRPAAYLDNDSFVIIGKTLKGYNSLPSGHSITVFTVLTIVMFSFAPKKLIYKILWFFFIIIIGLILIFTRVAVGAHYPLDVIIGGIVGYITGITGIFFSRKYKIWNWMSCKKYYPVFIILFLTFCVLIINKIINENLIIFYLALFSLVVSLYKIIAIYVKR